MHSGAFVPVVSAVVLVSGDETDHAAVRLQRGQQLAVVPEKTHGIRGERVDGEVTCPKSTTSASSHEEEDAAAFTSYHRLPRVFVLHSVSEPNHF